MEKFIIQGGRPLIGSLSVAGAKNSALPILIASLLTDEAITIHNVPQLEDIKTTLALLAFMGVQTERDKTDPSTLNLEASQVSRCVAPYDLVSTMRASILALGPLLARHGKAEVSLPGGCAIGSRPVDMHLEGLRSMGAEIEIKNGYIHAKTKGRLKGTQFVFDKITVNGTQNLMMAATLADGITTLENAAHEPEVVDLAELLNKMGAKITGAGSDSIQIEGVEKLTGTTHRIIPDRIEAATYLMAAMITQGDITLNDVHLKPLETLIVKLKQMGATVASHRESTSIRLTMDKRPIALDMTTSPYPGFPTDMQAQFMALNTIAEGRSAITETIFENRFMHVQELERMGASIKLQGHTAFITGVEKLTGAPVMATDLRASAGLVLAALVAEGETIINRIYHIDRGYENIEVHLKKLGARIERTR